MFAKINVIFIPILICVFSHTSTRFFYISGGIFKFSGYQFQLSTVCGSCSGLFITTDVTIRIFPVPIKYWSRFRIFKQNWEDPNKIGMVGQSGIWKTRHTILKSWIKALGHFFSGVFSNSHSSQTLPSTHKQSWIHISRIFFKFQLWIGWGGRTATQFQKGYIACEQAFRRGWNWGEWKQFFHPIPKPRACSQAKDTLFHEET